MPEPAPRSVLGINTVFPGSQIQLCIVHMVPKALRGAASSQLSEVCALEGL